jgi:4-amino-4-deoxy-L-arabinose transferase-like glycosyltransferase
MSLLSRRPSPPSARARWTPLAIALGAGALLTLPGLGGFGIWDPWELAVADLGRGLIDGTARLDRPPLGPWLVGASFALFGIDEAVGRLPMALSGLAVALLAYATAARFVDRRAGGWAAIVAVSSPFMVLHARQMLGQTPAFAASGAIFFCALSLLYLPAPFGAPPPQVRRNATLLGLGLAASVALGVLSGGVLRTVAPPLLAVGATGLARGDLGLWRRDRRRAATAGLLLGFGLLFAAGAAWAVIADVAGFRYWPGGVPQGSAPPTWERAIEALFHAFAPWSALLPIALGRLFTTSPRPTPEGPGPLALTAPHEGALRLAALMWVAFAFAAQTVFTARYGPAPFPAIGAAAIAVAILLRDVERSQRPWLGTAVVTGFFVLLILRDYRAFPSSPIEGLAIGSLQVPEAFHATPKWAAVLLLFGAAMAVGFGVDPRGATPDVLVRLRQRFRVLDLVDLGIPRDAIAGQWRRGWGRRVALIAALVAVVAATAAGVLGWVATDWLEARDVQPLGISVMRALVLTPVALYLLPATFRLAFALFNRFSRHRFVPIAVAGMLVGAYTAFSFLPELSTHFSPAEVYEAYNRLAVDDEPLGEYRVGGRAAAYYAQGELVELSTQNELVDFLQRDERVFAAFSADELPAINRAYRSATRRHVFVADARSARMVLAASQPIDGVENQNFLTEVLLDEAPRTMTQRVGANFDRRIELIGYDLDLPGGDHVSPGQRFAITWYFRVLARPPSGYQPFVHIDGPGMRIHGDHEPVDGAYPLRLWDVGDIVADRQELSVPVTYRRTNLTIYMGFYAGERRLEVLEGPADDENRVRAGVLVIR